MTRQDRDLAREIEDPVCTEFFHFALFEELIAAFSMSSSLINYFNGLLSFHLPSATNLCILS